MNKTMLIALFIAMVSSVPAMSGENVINMYKSENCGCCSLWGKAMEIEGFEIRTHVISEQELTIMKDNYSVPAGVRSCHTASAGNLIVEGHVTATAIIKAIKSAPLIYGIAVSGMPAGSPGMEAGDKKRAL